ncbi:MAG: hypothetical protein M1822_007403 [Bathelium mastoideum]|nr:MAG: hypothetical protein M1822_007403 [Bathelium mastoideum]
MENWRWYISDLEKKYVQIKAKAHLDRDYRVEEVSGTTSSTANLCVKDTQSIQFLQDQSQQLAYALEMDRNVLQNMRTRLDMMPGADTTCEGSVDHISALVADSNIQMGRVDSMLRRLDGTIALIRTILDFRCFMTLQNNSESMKEITSLTQLENRLIIELTRKASRDTDILKILTLLALTYLPASLASSILGMNYITIRMVKEKLSIHIEGEFFIFILLSVILLIVTFGPYLWYVRKHRLRPDDEGIEKDQEKNGA